MTQTFVRRISAYVFVFLLLGWHEGFAKWELAIADDNRMELKWVYRAGRQGEPIHLRTCFAVPPQKIPVVAGISENNTVTREQINLSEPSRFRDVLCACLDIHHKKPTPPGRLRLHIEFRNAPPQSQHLRSVFPPPETHPVEQTLKHWLINYKHSRQWRTLEQPAVLSKKNESIALPAERLLIKTADESIYWLNYENLKSSGLPIDNIDPRSLTLHFDQTPIPIYVHGESDGKFDKSDYIEFIGRRPLGTLTPSGRSYNSFYTDSAVLILTWGQTHQGLRASLFPVPGKTGGIHRDEGEGGVKKAGPYRVHAHIEKDIGTMRLGGVGEADIVDLGLGVSSQSITDFWIWAQQLPDKDILNVSFNLPNAPAQSLDNELKKQVRVSVRLHGLTDILTAQFDHHLKFLLNATDISFIGGVSNSAKWGGNKPYIWEGQRLSNSIIRKGENQLTIQNINDLKTSENELVKYQVAFLDYIEIDYWADYTVLDGNLTFSNDFTNNLGLIQFVLTNIEDKALSLWDKKGRKLVSYNLLKIGNKMQLSFTDSCVDLTHYVLNTHKNRKTPGLTMDTIPDLKARSHQADYLVITSKALAGASLDSLIRHRTKDGFVCKTVFVDHIYQAFGDGSTSPTAIRDFIKYAYHQWRQPSVSHVLLLGETSLWFDKMMGVFQKNHVPTHLIHIPGWGETSNDDYFSKISGDDNISDVFVGRIPVSDKHQLGHVVHKILRFENQRRPAHWHNKVLLVGGYEKNFTETNHRLQAVLAENGRQFSRIDVEQSSPYNRSSTAAPSFYDQLDSAFNLVSFVGHGGGSVWSDAGLLTMDELENDSLNGEFSIPLILSLTCLTGYFEDISMRSLGEEMVRRPTSGAIGFYGASGYISNQAGSLLGEALLSIASRTPGIRAGALIQQAESQISLLQGHAFDPILGEFDLLGDPALKIGFPSESGQLKLTTAQSSNGLDIEVAGSQLALESGTALISCLVNDSIVHSRQISFQEKAISTSMTVSSGVLEKAEILLGKIIIHYWNDQGSYILQGSFNDLDWVVQNFKIDPETPKVGERAKIQFSLSSDNGEFILKGGVIVYYVAGEKGLESVESSEILLDQAEDGTLETKTSFLLTPAQNQLLYPYLYYRLRLSVDLVRDGKTIQSINNLESSVQKLKLKNVSDITFSNPPIRVPIIDTLGFWVYLINHGYQPESEVHLSLYGLQADTTILIDKLPMNRTLKFNVPDSVFIRLGDYPLDQRFRFHIETGPTSYETNQRNNQIDTTITLKTALIRSMKDSIQLGKSVFITAREQGARGRVFWEPVSPKSIGAHLQLAGPTGSALNVQWRIASDEKGSKPDWNLSFLTEALEKKSSNIQLPAFHYFDATSIAWIRCPDAEKSVGEVQQFVNSGIYALFINGDNSPPHISFTSRGQFLKQDDYIPQESPIDITLRDNAGIDFLIQPPTIRSLSSDLDSLSYSINKPRPLSKFALIKLIPRRDLKKDSIIVEAQDVSGNPISSTFAFRFGRGLSLNIIGNYPNPFADTTIVVYQITDWVDKVTMKIFTRSGRLVKTIGGLNESGYRELTWDGTASDGSEVANGLYYGRVVARQGKKQTSDIVKIFKLKRK